MDDIIIIWRAASEAMLRASTGWSEICSLFKHAVKYLGHIISGDGVAVDPEWLTPKVSWLWWVFFKLLYLLTDTLSWYQTPSASLHLEECLLYKLSGVWTDGSTGSCTWVFLSLGGKYYPRTCRYRTPSTSPHLSFTWSEEAERAFRCLKHMLAQAPVLKFLFLVKSMWRIHMRGIEFICLQVEGGVEHPIAYFIYVLSCPEKQNVVQQERNSSLLSNQFSTFVLTMEYLQTSYWPCCTKVVTLSFQQIAWWIQQL